MGGAVGSRFPEMEVSEIEIALAQGICAGIAAGPAVIVEGNRRMGLRYEGPWVDGGADGEAS
jgi:hypothetical protein